MTEQGKKEDRGCSFSPLPARIKVRMWRPGRHNCERSASERRSLCDVHLSATLPSQSPRNSTREHVGPPGEFSGTLHCDYDPNSVPSIPHPCASEHPLLRAILRPEVCVCFSSGLLYIAFDFLCTLHSSAGNSDWKFPFSEGCLSVKNLLSVAPNNGPIRMKMQGRSPTIVDTVKVHVEIRAVSPLFVACFATCHHTSIFRGTLRFFATDPSRTCTVKWVAGFRGFEFSACLLQVALRYSSRNFFLYFCSQKRK